jgi:hypothetical protein
MGSVARDIYRKEREYDVKYEYNREGVSRLLRDIHRVSEQRWYEGDIDATAILVDLYKALDSDCLTPRMRQVVALYYFVGLTEYEVAEILNIERHSVNEFKQKAVYRIAEHMYDSPRFKTGDPYEMLDESNFLYQWLNDVAVKKAPIYRIPMKLYVVVNEYFAKTDDRAAEFLRQLKEGIEIPEEKEYPCLSEEQLAWRDRRMIYKDEVYPSNDVTGTRKVAVKTRDDKYGRDYIVEKRKIFKLKGN